MKNEYITRIWSNAENGLVEEMKALLEMDVRLKIVLITVQCTCVGAVYFKLLPIAGTIFFQQLESWDIVKADGIYIYCFIKCILKSAYLKMPIPRDSLGFNHGKNKEHSNVKKMEESFNETSNIRIVVAKKFGLLPKKETL